MDRHQEDVSRRDTWGPCTHDSEPFPGINLNICGEKNVEERKDRAEIQQPNNQSLYVR